MAYDEALADRLAGFLLKKVNKAVYEFGMIQDGDRIAVALSGGKDSFSLLRILRYRQRIMPEKVHIAAIHVIGDARGADMPEYPHLEDWLKQNKFDYLIRPTYLAHDEKLPMSCQRCTWNRRRTLFEMMSQLGCNKLAFGHHLDDLAQTVLLNLAHNGKLETMLPVRDYFDGAIKIIRPLMYVPETELKRFSAVNDFPPPPPECPRGEHSHRKLMKDLLLQMQKDCRTARVNLVRAALGKVERTL